MPSFCVESPADYKYNYHCYGRGPFYSVHEFYVVNTLWESGPVRSPGPNDCPPRLPVCSGRLHPLFEAMSPKDLDLSGACAAFANAWAGHLLGRIKD